MNDEPKSRLTRLATCPAPCNGIAVEVGWRVGGVDCSVCVGPVQEAELVDEAM